MTLLTVFDEGFDLDNSDFVFKYQDSLTNKLDNDFSDFNQERLNEIILWKVNRYASFDSDLISLINALDSKGTKLDESKTREILKRLLNTKGVKLAMASTILRFKNPKVYQIIDQRVFRIIYPGRELKYISYLSEKQVAEQIEVYITYLNDLRQVCEKLNIDFEISDRVLFMADKRINKKIKIKNY